MEKNRPGLTHINKVLVANRGEIAVRIFNSLHHMGICTVAVYSDADADAWHSRIAFERHKLAGKSLAETYLNIEQLIKAAINSGADAIHPGYGFLSENPEFARSVYEAGLIFIGPGADAISKMGNKKEARELAKKAGLPVIEGVSGDDQTLKAKALEIGFPVLVKAAAGGGGKGMRIAYSENELEDILEATKREALKYFGNDEVYIEKLLPTPRHIEVQLLADKYGKVLSLYERECSIQRRHQKIIEEAPAPGITANMRQQLTEAARQLAMHIDYESAGTVEFLVQDDKFFFLEMNTRIQVEHPVTEAITGIDIVKEQIYIATGRPLPYSQDDIQINGHAIEARIYAEDPQNNFLPSPGNILLHQIPEGKRLRVDSALDTTGKVSSMFDPMISKIIFHASSRETARKKIIQHLKNYVIFGIKTNISFLINLLDSEAFTNASMHTRIIDDSLDAEQKKLVGKSTNERLLAIAYLFIHPGNNRDPFNTWQHIGHWRLMPEANVVIDSKVFTQKYMYHNAAEMSIMVDDQEIVYRLVKHNRHNMHIEVGGTTHTLYYLLVNGEVLFQHEGVTCRISPVRYLGQETLTMINENPVLEGESMIKAPMHGNVIKVLVSPGKLVNKGDTLLILESMKMENKITATARAYVKEISVSDGDVVADNSPLVLLTNTL